MPRIVGVDIPNEKPLAIALTYIYGVGNTTAKKVVTDLSMRADMRAKDLSDDDAARIAAICKSITWSKDRCAGSCFRTSTV